MNPKSLPIRKVTRTYRVSLRYEVGADPLTVKEVESLLQNAARPRGLQGLTVLVVPPTKPAPR